MNTPPRIAFFGTPELARIILQTLCENSYEPTLVITAPDKPAGRGNKLAPPPVKTYAQERGIEVLQPERLGDIAADLERGGFDLFIVAAYGVIIPRSILDIPARGTLNVHGSLLPKYRGASPIQAAILNGDSETGPTIMLMDAKMDHGPILAQRTFPIAKNETGATLFEKMAREGALLLVETLPGWLAATVKVVEQEHEQATYTKLITKEDGHIRWEESARVLERTIRAYDPWPGTFSFYNGMRVKIRASHVSGAKSTQGAGTVVRYEDGIAVVTGDGLLIVDSLQLEGKRPQSGEEFVRTYPDIVGTKLT